MMSYSADKSKKVHEVQCSDDENEFFIDLIENKNQREEWRLEISTNGTCDSYKLDMGSQVNIIPKKVYQKLAVKP